MAKKMRLKNKTFLLLKINNKMRLSQINYNILNHHKKRTVYKIQY